MQLDKFRKIILGLFIVVGAALFIIAIFIIGSKENLFTDTFTLHTEFETVSGLKEGNSVRFAGIDVGTVDKIEIQGSNKVIVTMTIESNVQRFIKKDSEVTIGSEGLVGNKIIAISGGTVSQSAVDDADYLKSIKPVDIGDILNTLNESTKETEKIAKEITDIVTKVNDGKGTLGQLVNNSSLYYTIDSTMRSFASYTGTINQLLYKTSNAVDQVSEDITDFTHQVRLITNDIKDITHKINSSESLIGTLLTDTVFANHIKQTIKNTNQTTANLERGSFGFYQNMEALKHNFLFKGYFEDLGYWDKSEFEKDVDKRESRILQKEKEIDERERQLDELRKKLEELEKKLNLIEEK
ncbi:MAG: MCE family protein [Ignavibacteria bacterium]|nr:MCE family protein [Ignavibacteria bacterium]